MQQNNPKPSNQNTDAKLVNLQKGKLPPQAVDIEEVVIGAMMVDKRGVDDAIDILDPTAFYDTRHQTIFSAIYELFEEGNPIDLMTISNKLKSTGKLSLAGGDVYLITLSQKTASSAHIEYHARIIVQKYIQRSLISIAAEIQENAYDETADVLDMLDNAEAKLFEVTQGNLKKGAQVASSLVSQAIEKIEADSKKEGMSGLQTGFTKLDELTSGWQPTDLIIIAARPAMGKTAFVVSMAKNMAVDFNQPVALFSLEMPSVQLITRMISSETGIEGEKLKKGNLDPHEWEQLHVKVKKLAEAPIYIDDTPSLSIFDLRAKARRLVSQHGIKIIIIDYLQLMTAGGSSSGGNREQEISMISRNLKALAKELHVPVIALSQLSRAVESRGGSKRPQLSDLRESGAIEQDADIVSFVYRPDYYGFTEWDDEEHLPCKDQAELMIAKHRNGGLDNVRLKFIGALTKFTNLESSFSGGNNEFQSSMNSGEDPGLPSPSANDAFGIDENNNASNSSNDDGLPF